MTNNNKNINLNMMIDRTNHKDTILQGKETKKEFKEPVSRVKKNNFVIRIRFIEMHRILRQSLWAVNKVVYQVFRVIS